MIQAAKTKLTFAFCAFNRARRLERMVAAMRAQQCRLPFEILAVNNNSSDDTLAVLERLAQQPGPSLRFVTEMQPGIVCARNRALSEGLDSDILVFIDDDETPLPGLLEEACVAIIDEGARCAGGRILVDFSDRVRPWWLGDELLGFLAAVDCGPSPYWITDEGTPVWTANVAYDMSLFRDNPSLRFDNRYNREGDAIGGGEDVVMFRRLLAMRVRIKYCPGMVVLHEIEPGRLRPGYFLKRHYGAGVRVGQHELQECDRKILGVPPFMVAQFIRQCGKALAAALRGRSDSLRQAMNVAHAWGVMVGYLRRDRNRLTV